jgi:hypothetical protein
MKRHRTNNTCWLCGSAGGPFNELERHHIFGGPNRKKSERYDLVVYLCGDTCHRNGRRAVHRNAETARDLHEYGQKKAMLENGWSTEEFIQQFGKNYL